MKKRLALMCVVLLIAMLAALTNGNDAKAATSTSITLTNNESEVFKNRETIHKVESISVDFAKLPIESNNYAAVALQGTEWLLTQSFPCSIEDYESGLFIVLDGVVDFGNEKCDVIISIAYKDVNDCFAIITISNPETSSLEAYCFGDYSKAVRKICKEKKLAEERLGNTTEETVPEETRVNGSIVYQAQQNVYQGGYNTATATLFHADEMSNQGITYVYVKANSHVSNFTNYARYSMGLNGDNTLLSVIADSFESRLTGLGEDYKIINNSWNPVSGTTSYSVSVPLYIPYIGCINFNQSYTVSSTTVTTSQTSTAHYTNRINWSVSKTNGFGSSLEGSYNSSTGAMCECAYTYAANLSSSTNKSIEATARVRYKCTYVVLPDNGYEEGDVYYYYVWSPTATCTGTMTILP